MKNPVMAAVRKLAGPITSQFARPHGLGAPIVAPFLNRVNGRVNSAAVAALEVAAGERILEVGFGGGIGMRLALAAIGDGHLTGVDVSPEIVRRAQRSFRAEIARGRVEVLQGDVTSLPLPDGAVDGAFAVNSVYFWPDLGAGLSELLRVLGPTGRLVIAMEASARGLHRVFVSDQPLPGPEEVAGVARGVGFSNVVVTRPQRDVELVQARKS
jgi:arsenite methyltransferase